ncbi:MAG: sensor histidine kinase [Xenococcaceae cyanobacterium]
MKSIRIIHLEDNTSEAELIEKTLAKDGVNTEIILSTSRTQYIAAIERGDFELILSDSGVANFSGRSAMTIARLKYPQVPFVFVSGNIKQADAIAYLHEGATDCIRKDELWRLTPIIERISKNKEFDRPTQFLKSTSSRHNRALELLVTVVQKLSLAKDLNMITAIVRRAARELTNADGASFVLREGDLCYYADEDAIAPLWKGKRFPASICIGGWCMDNRQQVIIEDVFGDDRIPIAAYQLTFIKSMAMVPIRTEKPIGAIGVYWAKQHAATDEEVSLIQALADTTSVAMENVRVFDDLEKRVRERTTQLEFTNKELEAFCYTLSHDLRNPLTSVIGFSELLQLQCAKQLNEKGQRYLKNLDGQAKLMKSQIEAMLALYKLNQSSIELEEVNLSDLAAKILSRFQQYEPNRQVNIIIDPELKVCGDRTLLNVVLENLLANAWKYSSKKPQTTIEFRCCNLSARLLTFYIKDNGAGFDLTSADRLFQPFKRMHSEDEFPGNGVGLASVQRIICKHGGKIWAESAPDQGATFYFSLPNNFEI